MILFWFAVFITAFRPEILDDIVKATGLFNKSQFLLVLSFELINKFYLEKKNFKNMSNICIIYLNLTLTYSFIT